MYLKENLLNLIMKGLEIVPLVMEKVVKTLRLAVYVRVEVL